MLSTALLLSLSLPQEPAVATTPAPPPRDLAPILAVEPSIAPILQAARAHRLQILLAEPIVLADGRIVLRRSHLGDPRQYFYPASSIKLCGAVAALLELQRLNGDGGPPVGLTTPMRIGAWFPDDVEVQADASNLDGGRLTLGHDLRKLFLVSDNAAYNHTFELVGPRRLNEAMWQAGLASCRLWHRLSEARSLADNRRTRPVTFQLGDAERRIAGREDGIELDNDGFAELDVGEAWLRDGERVAGPMSFAQKNAIALQDLQDLLVEVVRPEIDTGKRGFPELSLAHRAFAVQALGELPRESRNPRYDAGKYGDEFCKFVLPGLRRVVPAADLRVWNKIGRAYGFSIENAYVEDLRTGRGFFLAIVLYTNPDGVLNDDRYAYETIADPFLATVGELVARAVWPQPRSR